MLLFQRGDINTFDEILIVCPNPDQELYEFARERIANITFLGEDVPDVESFNDRRETNKLIVFDDMMLEHGKTIIDYFVQGDLPFSFTLALLTFP